MLVTHESTIAADIHDVAREDYNDVQGRILPCLLPFFYIAM